MPNVLFESLVPGGVKPMGMKPQLMQDRGVNIRDIVGFLYCMKTKLIGTAVGYSPLDATPRHPDAESVGVMIATIGTL